MGAPIAIIDKRRDKPNQVKEITHVIGKVYRRTAILVDDIVDTAGTLTAAAAALVARGVEDVYACCAHPILSGPAIERLAQSPIRELVATNTVPVSQSKRIDKVRIVSIAPLLAEAIRRIHEDRSVSTLFAVPPS
jgi:ribose-phosphate pyrophosphokinase